MYSNARSRVHVGDGYSEKFEVKVGVHQGSVLSLMLFIIVLEACHVSPAVESHGLRGKTIEGSSSRVCQAGGGSFLMLPGRHALSSWWL